MKFTQLQHLFGEAALPDITFTGVTADSRDVKRGDIFVALPGVKVDGAQFAGAAIKAGAVAVICDGSAVFDAGDVAVLRVKDPRRALALIAAALKKLQPETIVAVTGTAGKTSVASFVRQIYAHAGKKAASIGTTGVVSPDLAIEGALTTPDPVQLHAILSDLAETGVTHAAMEASSHGLDQRRLDGVRLAAAAFTNLGRDHMDYHATIDEYLACKMRLFDTLMKPGQPAVIFADDVYSDAAIAAGHEAGLDVCTVGRKGDFIALKRVEHERHKQIVELVHAGATYRVELPLAGEFQVANAVVAAGLAISTGIAPRTAFAALEKLEGAPGRLELVGTSANGALVYVDYAHKPEALEQVLSSVRPFTTGRVLVVFGCGGDRDAGKRQIMGAIAARLADLVYVTDDNPRSEEPAGIRAAIMETAIGAIEIGDRREAIFTAVDELRTGDTLIIAGKGHETGQTANGKTVHFSDHEEVRAALAKTGVVADKAAPLWTGEAMIEAMGARPIGNVPAGINGISIDTRTLQPGDAYFAIKGDRLDGHDFASAAVAAGAGVLVVAESRLPALGGITKPLLVVDDVLEAMRKLGIAARARSKAKIIAVTGSAGKTTTKDALAHVLAKSGRVHYSPASFNNHWGVPLTLARMPEATQFAVFEIGMNHAGEITPLVKMVRPHVAMVTLIAAAHLGHFKDLDDIAHAKAEIFRGLVRGGTALINRDDKRFKLLAQLAGEAGVHRIAGYGESNKADVHLLNAKYLEDCSTVTAKVFGEDVAFKVGVPGRHVVLNSLGVLGAVHLVGGDLSAALHALSDLQAPDGRGRTYQFKSGDGTFTLIDESYNANTASIAAVLQHLSDIKPKRRGRRIAVLGDMLELGMHSKKLHEGLAEPVLAAGLSRLLLGGAEMKALADKLAGSDLHVEHFETVDDLMPVLQKTVRADDVVLVKSSNGLGFSRIVKTYKDAAAPGEIASR